MKTNENSHGYIKEWFKISIKIIMKDEDKPRYTIHQRRKLKNDFWYTFSEKSSNNGYSKKKELFLQG